MKAAKGNIPDCDNCRPILLESNYPVISLIERYGVGMFDGMGSINTHGVELAVKYEYWMNAQEQSIMLQKLLIYLGTAISVNSRNYKKENIDAKNT